jgi:small subunit ribosomal protein S13
MARIAGVTLIPNKKTEFALRYIYGIGETTAKKVLAATGVDGDIRIKDLPEEDVNKLRSYIEKSLKVEGELRREILANIKRLKDIGSHRGSRHAKGLPVRGQRTKTNNRTVRGNVRRTMGSGRTKLEKT